MDGWYAGWIGYMAMTVSMHRGLRRGLGMEGLDVLDGREGMHTAKTGGQRSRGAALLSETFRRVQLWLRV